MHETMSSGLTESKAIGKERTTCGRYSMTAFPYSLPELEATHVRETKFESINELNVSFGYKCSVVHDSSSNTGSCAFEMDSGSQGEESNFMSRSSSFSCLSGAALSANYTLANTNICNGKIGEEILPGLDSPNTFKRMTSSASFSRLDSPSSSPTEVSPQLSYSSYTDGETLESGNHVWKSAPVNLEPSSFLLATDVKLAGGAAGEDRVQAVCSEENGWLYCGVYDGFNGRDAADFLASTLYENIALNLHHFEWDVKQRGVWGNSSVITNMSMNSPPGTITTDILPSANALNTESGRRTSSDSFGEFSTESFCNGIMNCLTLALSQAEREFMHNVEQEMEDRPDLVSVGSCVLAMLLHGRDLYIVNLGDSRAVLAIKAASNRSSLKAVQLTEIHTVDNESEYRKLLEDHPNDPSPIIDGRVKGKLRLTRAFGVGYLKKKKMNNALMGILRVRNLGDPPYVYTHPFTLSHKVTENDLFVVLGSDGLFDFFSNQEVVELVNKFIQEKPFGDPAKHLVEQLVLRAAHSACLSTEDLMKVPVGRRRKYHDDVTVIVIMLGNDQRTSKASTYMRCKG